MRIFLSTRLRIFIFVYFFSYTTLESSIDISVWNQYKITGYIVRSLSRPFTKESLTSHAPLLIPNRLLLYGPPGNGKTTLAYEIAKAANCEFVHISASSIVTSYQGSGAENIKKELTNAYSKILEGKRPVVVFIDEIDAIAIVGNSGSFRTEHNNAIQELWQFLDNHKHDPCIFIICATNRYEELSQAFVSRFPEQQRIKLDQPDEKMRKKVLLNLTEKYNLDLFGLVLYNEGPCSIGDTDGDVKDILDLIYRSDDGDINAEIYDAIKNTPVPSHYHVPIHEEIEKLIDDLAGHSHGMSIRELENFIQELKITFEFESYLTYSELIEKIKTYPRGYKENNNTPDAKFSKRDIYDKIHLVYLVLSIISTTKTLINSSVPTTIIDFTTKLFSQA